MTKSTYRGNPIVFKDEKWTYEGTGKLVQSDVFCKCGKCGNSTTEEGHDYCLGTLAGVMNACCGHGVESEAYVQFLDGECVRGEDAVIIQNILKKYNKKEND